jgi:hypothetical protein
MLGRKKRQAFDISSGSNSVKAPVYWPRRSREIGSHAQCYRPLGWASVRE